MYLRDENAPVLARNFEQDPENILRLRRLKSKLSERHTVATFASAHDLAVKVAADIGSQHETLERAAELSRTTIEPSSLVQLDVAIADARTAGLDDSALAAAVREAIRRARRAIVFISYADADAAVAISLAKALTQRGVVARAGIEEPVSPADTSGPYSISGRIDEAVRAADVMIFLLSAASLASKWVGHELALAFSLRVRTQGRPLVVPALVEDVAVPASLRDVAFIDLRQGAYENAADSVLGLLKR